MTAYARDKVGLTHQYPQVGIFFKLNNFPKSNYGLPPKCSFLAKYCQGCNSSVFRKYLKHIILKSQQLHVLYKCKFRQIPFTLSSFAYKASNTSSNTAFSLSIQTNYKFQAGNGGGTQNSLNMSMQHLNMSVLHTFLKTGSNLPQQSLLLLTLFL